MKIKGLVVATTLAFAGTANATDIFVGTGIGLMGVNIEAGYYLTDSLAARVGYNFGSLSAELDETDADYDAEFEFSSLSVLGDWYFSQTGFRLTGGVYLNGNEIEANARPKSNDTFDIGNTTYNLSDIDSVNGKVTFADFSPYFGIGWSNHPNTVEGLSLTADLGVLYQGSPELKFTANCINPSVCSLLDSDLRAEEQDLMSQAEDYKWFPVASIGLRYRF